MSKFTKLVRQLEKKHVRSPAALAAWIGRKKYGVQEFKRMGLRGRRKL
jgi:hypothetical protein